MRWKGLEVYLFETRSGVSQSVLEQPLSPGRQPAFTYEMPRAQHGWGAAETALSDELVHSSCPGFLMDLCLGSRTQEL